MLFRGNPLSISMWTLEIDKECELGLFYDCAHKVIQCGKSADDPQMGDVDYVPRGLI